ncbi:hypothetical protein [Pseudotamlana carrageenivorans]|uniref:Uncharacterized protein n=1 Tax=Pseudotamlana carrageenivorans TaxID=2069432 RepID=A0A2I7SDK3_9FLAO|nr:hypothetical protein [Tamlana carrageenivorans]AUS03977.1 hypothetical protein C1A40_00080 [Tamlana carrageenivorans]
MKINFYFILIFLFFGSVASAQISDSTLKTEKKQQISVVRNITVNMLTPNKVILLDELKVNLRITRLESDIKLYYKRQKKISNISLVFPKMNLEALA